MNCGRIQNRDHCGELCVTDGWYSKVRFTLAVNANQICIDQGYNGEILEYRGNSQVQCKYPGSVYGIHTKMEVHWIVWAKLSLGSVKGVQVSLP